MTLFPVMVRYILPERDSHIFVGDYYAKLLENGNTRFLSQATEVAAHFDDLVNILKHKRDETFLTSEVQSFLNTLIDAGEIQKFQFTKTVMAF